MRRAGAGAARRIGTHRTHHESRIVMKTVLPPWQLTTSELAREISALEASPDGSPSGSGGQPDGRLAALHEERDVRQRLSEHLAERAGRQFPDDEPW
jgi:hypothetical protein